MTGVYDPVGDDATLAPPPPPAIPKTSAKKDRRLASDAESSTVPIEQWGRFPWDWFFYILLAIGGIVLLFWDSHMKFYSDDWSWLSSSRSISEHPMSALFGNYNGHWVTVPVLIYRGTLSLFGMGHYWPFAVPLIAFHLLNVVFSRILLLRSGISQAVSTLLPCSLLFLATAYTDLLWGFPDNLVGAVTFGLGAAVVLTGTRVATTHVVIAAGLCVLAVATSDAGIGMTAGVIVLALLRFSWQRAAHVGLPAALSFLIWYAFYGRLSPSACAAGQQASGFLRSIIFFVSANEKGVAGLGSTKLFSVVFTLVGLIGVIEIVRRRDRLRTAWAWPIGAAVADVVVYISITIGRSCTGTAVALAPRYTYFSAVLLMPVVAVGFDCLQRWIVRRYRTANRLALIVPLVLVLIVANNGRELEGRVSCRELRVDHGWEEVANITVRPSLTNPQVTIAEVNNLEEHFGLQLPRVPRSTPEIVEGC